MLLRLARLTALLAAILAAILAVSLSLGMWAPSLARAQDQKPSDRQPTEKTQSVSSLLKRGQSHFDEQHYEQSIQVLSAALLRPVISKQEKISVYKLLAYNYIVLQHEQEADGAVRGLLAQEPGFALAETESPRFRDFFDKVRQRWEEEGRPGLVVEKVQKPRPPVRIEHRGPAQIQPDAAARLDGTIVDPDARVDRLTLFYRQGSKGKFKSRRVRFAMRKFTVDIPGVVVQAPLVEYYLEAVDDKGLPVATRGDAAGPLRIAVSSGGSVLTSPWFWIPVGAAVVAAVVVVAVIASGSPESSITVNVFE